MDFEKVKKSLLTHGYLSVRLDSNFNVLKQLRTEKNLCILGEDITSKQFLTNLDHNLQKYSLLYFHDFQRGDIFDRQLIKEWKERYDQGGVKLPYLLMSGYSLYYSHIPLVFDKDRFLDFSEGEPKISYSSINFTDTSDVDQKLYDRMCDIIVNDIKDKKGYRGLAIVPNSQSMEYMCSKLKSLTSDHNIIKIDRDNIPDSAFFSEQKARKYSKNFIFISLDLTHLPIFITELDVVYDSGEKDQIYESRTGYNRLKTVKINRQEMKARMMSYAPEYYMIMFPKTSILGLEKYYTPDINDDIDILTLIDSGLKPEQVPQNLKNYGLVKDGKDGFFTLTDKAKFCMAISVPVKHSSFIHQCLTEYKHLIRTVIVLVSIFTNIDLYDSCVTFDQIYFSVFKKLSGVDIECPEEIVSSIEELSEALDVEHKILDPKEQFSLVIPRIKNHYRQNILKYKSGNWEDGKGNKYVVKNIKECNISNTILPLTVWRDRPGNKFVGHYLPLADQKMI